MRVLPLAMIILVLLAPASARADSPVVDSLAARGRLGIPIGRARLLESELGQLFIVNVDGFGYPGEPLALEPDFAPLVEKPPGRGRHSTLRLVGLPEDPQDQPRAVRHDDAPSSALLRHVRLALARRGAFGERNVRGRVRGGLHWQVPGDPDGELRTLRS